MDSVNVTDTALAKAARALKELQTNINSTVTVCEQSLATLIAGFTRDDQFIADITRFIETLKNLDRSISEFVNENASAIFERYKYMNDYIAKSYVKRTFG